MKRLLLLSSGALALLLSTPAFALKSGDTIYVRARDAVLHKDSSGTGDKPLLQPGEKLIWLEQDKANPRYHKVKAADGKAGYVFFQKVSTTPPKGEVVLKDGRTQNIDAQAFASYGAAARGLTEEAKGSAKKKSASAEKTARQLEKVENIAKKHDKPDGSVK